MGLIIQRKKEEHGLKFRQANVTVWTTLAIWLLGVCLFLVFSTDNKGAGRWLCTVFTFLSLAFVIWLAGFYRRKLKAVSMLLSRLDNGERYREYLVFNRTAEPENVDGIKLVPCFFKDTAGGERKIYLLPFVKSDMPAGTDVTVMNTAGIVISCTDREGGKELLEESEDVNNGITLWGYLERSWIMLFAALAASVIFTGLFFNLFHAPKASESVYVFFAGTVNDHSIEKDFVRDVSDAGVKLCVVSSSDPLDATFMQKYTVVGLNAGNIIIVPLDIADATALHGTSFEEFCGGAALPENIGTEPGYYVRDGVNVGRFVEGNVRNKLSRYFKMDDGKTYVMFVSYAGFGETRGSSGYAVARMMEWLFEE